MSESEQEHDMLTTAEALRLTGFSRQTLYRRWHAGLIAPVPGNPALKKQPLRWRRADIERLLNPPSA